MKHQSPQEITATATMFMRPQGPKMSRRERIEHWAAILERHGGPLNALREIEYLPANERRAAGGCNTPLTIAFNDPVLREEGLKGDRLGDAMEFFGLNDGEAHRLLCDCHYLGNMTGKLVAKRLRRHMEIAESRSRMRHMIGRIFGFA